MLSARPSGRCFTHEFLLSVDEGTRRTLNLRLRAGCDLYNAYLQEALTRLAALRADPAWHVARRMQDGKARLALLRAAGGPVSD